MTMNDPLLRTDSYAKIFLYNTHETVACVPRHTIRMRCLLYTSPSPRD